MKSRPRFISTSRQGNSVVTVNIERPKVNRAGEVKVNSSPSEESRPGLRKRPRKDRHVVRQDQDAQDDVTVSKFKLKRCYVKLVDINKGKNKGDINIDSQNDKNKRRKVVTSDHDLHHNLEGVQAVLAVIEIKQARSVEVEKSGQPEDQDLNSMAREVRLLEDENKAVNEVAEAIALGTELTRQRIRKRKCRPDTEGRQDRKPIVPRIIKKELRKDEPALVVDEGDNAGDVKVFRIVDDDYADQGRLCIDLQNSPDQTSGDEDRMRKRMREAFDRAREERLATLKTKVSTFKKTIGKIRLENGKKKVKKLKKEENSANNDDESKEDAKPEKEKKRKKNPVVPRIISVSPNGTVIKKSYYIPTGKPRGRPKGSGSKQNAPVVKQQQEQQQQQEVKQQEPQQQHQSSVSADPGPVQGPPVIPDDAAVNAERLLKVGRPKGVTFPASRLERMEFLVRECEPIFSKRWRVIRPFAPQGTQTTTEVIQHTYINSFRLIKERLFDKNMVLSMSGEDVQKLTKIGDKEGGEGGEVVQREQDGQEVQLQQQVVQPRQLEQMHEEQLQLQDQLQPVQQERVQQQDCLQEQLQLQDQVEQQVQLQGQLQQVQQEHLQQQDCLQEQLQHQEQMHEDQVKQQLQQVNQELVQQQDCLQEQLQHQDQVEQQMQLQDQLQQVNQEQVQKQDCLQEQLHQEQMRQDQLPQQDQLQLQDQLQQVNQEHLQQQDCLQEQLQHQEQMHEDQLPQQDQLQREQQLQHQDVFQDQLQQDQLPQPLPQQQEQVQEPTQLVEQENMQQQQQQQWTLDLNNNNVVDAATEAVPQNESL